MKVEAWIDGCAESDIAATEARVVKASGKRIAVFRGEDGALYALDDQCPHEGYPLAKGALAGCVLTCKWHNFKFDVRTGDCLMGDEPVRVYPLRTRGGRIEIDVADPPPELAAARVWKTLEAGLLERKLGQVARDLVRLLALGVTPLDLARYIAVFDARYAEWGTTHVLPVAVDVIAEAERRAQTRPADAALPLMQAFELASESHTRRPLRERAAPLDPGEGARAAGAKMAALIEGEDRDGAISLLRGAIAKGWRRAEIEPWLYQAVCTHFLDFGHAMIYLVKLFDLLETVDWRDADPLLTAYLESVVTGTREDTLPEWRYFEDAWAEVRERAPALYAKASSSANHAADPTLTQALESGERSEALGAVTEAIESGVSLEGVVNSISLAASSRLLRFDLAIDAGVETQHDWLDVTHTLTYANALRKSITRFREPEIMRAIFFGARFVNATRVLDAPKPIATPSDVPDPALAWESILNDRATRPIVVAHLIKTLVAAEEESAATASPLPLLAAGRVLASPIRERRVGRAVHEAIRLVIDGKVPRTLY